MTRIKGDSNVMDMLRENDSINKVDIHIFDRKVASSSALEEDVVADATDNVEANKNRDLEEKGSEQLKNSDEDLWMDQGDNTFLFVDGKEDEDSEYSDDDFDLDQERIDYIHKLQEIKRQRADPRNRCEGDTDDEDLFVPVVDWSALSVVPVDSEDVAEAISNKAQCGVVNIQDGTDVASSNLQKKNSTKASRNVEGQNDVGSSQVEETVFSDPPSEDGGASAVEYESSDDGQKLDAQAKRRKRRRRESRVVNRRIYFDEDNIMDTTQLQEAMCFTDVDQYRRALKSYHIVQGRDYRYTRNEPRRVNVKCKEENCPFIMRGSRIAREHTFMLREMIPHTCGTTRANSRLNSTWLSYKYLENFRSDPDWKVSALQDQCMRELGTDVSKAMAYRAKRKAGEKVLGNHKKQYMRIRDYLQTVIDKNPGSTAVVSTVDRIALGMNPRFYGLFICLNAQRQGFLDGCRPFISKFYHLFLVFLSHVHNSKSTYEWQALMGAL